MYTTIKAVPNPLLVRLKRLIRLWDKLMEKRIDLEMYQNKISEEMFQFISRYYNQRLPAIFLHGIRPRSGTNFVGSVLDLHPDISVYPRKIWEIPFIENVEYLITFQKHFLAGLPPTSHHPGPMDLIALMGNAFVQFLCEDFEPGKIALLKRPSVKNISLFHTVFPRENLIVLIRDGRDVVSSTIKTWPKIDFNIACHDWEEAAREVIAYKESERLDHKRVLIKKYEEVVEIPDAFVREACAKFGLDINKFPYEELNRLPVIGSSQLKRDGRVTFQPIDKPTDFKTIGHWEQWTKKQKRVFKKIAGASLIAFGYEPNMNW